jgi:hypothetical protein
MTDAKVELPLFIPLEGEGSALIESCVKATEFVFGLANEHFIEKEALDRGEPRAVLFEQMKIMTATVMRVILAAEQPENVLPKFAEYLAGLNDALGSAHIHVIVEGNSVLVSNLES